MSIAGLHCNVSVWMGKQSCGLWGCLVQATQSDRHVAWPEPWITHNTTCAMHYKNMCYTCG
jgi:hypothetical protein